MRHGIFDSHAHYDDAKFDGDRAGLLRGLPASGVIGVINCATNEETARSTLALAEEYDYIFAALGCHPEEVDADFPTYLEALAELAAAHPRVVAVGEIGLDYHWRKDNAPLQKEVFARELELASEIALPVVIHDREAHADVMELCRRYRPRGVLHSFSGSAELAKEYVAMGMYIGVGGALTYQYAKKQPRVVAEIPLDRLLVETDAPYSTPEPLRGERNDSTKIPLVAERIAEIKGVTADEVLDAAAQNAEKIFGIL